MSFQAIWSLGRLGARGWAAAAGSLLVVGLGGCAQAGGTKVTATGTTLAIYMSLPSAPSPAAQDVAAAEELAFSQSGGQVGTFKLRLIRLSSGELSDHARTAIQDSSAIAYIGEIEPGSSADTIGITNAVDLLQISPTDTGLELTQATPAVSGAPNRYYESTGGYGHSFARVVPTSAQEARAQVRLMRRLGVSRLYVSDDGTPYGRTIAQAVRQAAASNVQVVSAPASAQAMFLGALAGPAAQRTLSATAAANPALKLFVPSALSDPGFLTGLGSAARRVIASQPGFMPSSLSPAGSEFVSQFKTRYGHAPAPESIFGYEAVKALLAVLSEAGSSANDRTTVVKDFFAIHARPSALGTYSIDSSGDTTLASFVFSRERGGRFAPFTSVTPTG